MGYLEMYDLEGNGPYTYIADHLHFHAPAEHTFNGVRHDLEGHIVHNLVDGPDMENYHW